jgi:tetratricopeptide (TPR) repeat protein
MVPPEYPSALQDLELSYNLSENKFKPVMQRGFVKRRVGRPEEAMEDLKRALALDQKSREAYNHLGMALLDAGHFELALGAFEDASMYSDQQFLPNVNNNKALALFRLGRHEECMNCFLEALSNMQAPEAAFYYNRGTVHLKMSDWTAAASDFENAVGINAEMPVYHYGLSVALERIGRRTEAYASLQKALELAPHFIPALHELSALQFSDSKFSESEATASSLLALRPTNGGFPVIFPSRVTMLQPLFPDSLAWLLLPRDFAETFILRGQARISMKKCDAALHFPLQLFVTI